MVVKEATTIAAALYIIGVLPLIPALVDLAKIPPPGV